MFKQIYNWFTGTRERTAWYPLSQVPPGYFSGRSEYHLSMPGRYCGEDTALSLSPFWAGLRLYQSTLASLPLIVYKTDTDGGREEARSNPAYPLLASRPNPAQSRAVFFESLMLDYWLHGECFVHAQWANNQRLLGLYPIPAYAVQRIDLDDQWHKTYTVTGYDTPLQHDEVVHIVNFSRDGGHRGCSFLRYASESLGLHKQVQSAASSLYENMPRVSGVMKQAGQTNKGAKEELKTEMREKFSGSANTGGVMFIPLGYEFEPLDHKSAADAQIVEALGASVADIARWFGVSPMQLGDMTAGAGVYVTSASDKLAFYQRCLLPILTKIELEFSHLLFGVSGNTYCEFDTDNVLRVDPETQARVWHMGIDDGYILRSECRQWLSLPVVEGIDDEPEPTPVIVQQPPAQDTQTQEDATDAATISTTQT